LWMKGPCYVFTKLASGGPPFSLRLSVVFKCQT
jgi:hypothetical protein